MLGQYINVCFRKQSLEKLRFSYIKIQDTLDNDKGQKSAISGDFSSGFRIFSSGFFFCFSPGFMCKLVRQSPPNVEKVARFPGEGSKSCRVCGCHGFLSREIILFLELISRRLHYTNSLLIQRITWRNCLRFISWKISFQLHKRMFSELISQ